jgi:hypothetical protein
MRIEVLVPGIRKERGKLPAPTAGRLSSQYRWQPDRRLAAS